MTVNDMTCMEAYKDTSSVKEKLSSAAEKIEKALSHYLDDIHIGSTLTADAIRYSTLGGGKRIRAYLVLEFCRMFGGCEEAAVMYACALECVHAYSLIHDDLPCMDDDDLRRGKASCHVKFGEADALLAGDGLLTYAFELCASNEHVSAESIRHAVKVLSHEAGISGMVGGQSLDLGGADDYDSLIKIFKGKTSALIKAACMLGYFAACDSPSDEAVARIGEYAENIGIAFQIHDDILDVKSTTEVLGKAVGSDEKNDKKTSLAFMSLSEAEREEERLTSGAIEAISIYDGSDDLCRFAVWLLGRNK